jgi:hypothetical protein
MEAIHVVAVVAVPPLQQQPDKVAHGRQEHPHGPGRLAAAGIRHFGPHGVGLAGMNNNNGRV